MSFKNQNLRKKKKWFLNDLLRGYLETIFFQEVNKKNIYRGKPENDLYYRG